MKYLMIAFLAVVVAGCSALSGSQASKSETNVWPDPYDMTYRGGQ
jgi:PBP1b-binding outer membrane lipoprotein LpoB